MTIERYILGICSILFVILAIEFTGIVEAKVAYQSNIAAHHASTLQYERSRDRLERHFGAVRDRSTANIEYTDFATLIGETTQTEAGHDTNERSVEDDDEAVAEQEGPTETESAETPVEDVPEKDESAENTDEESKKESDPAADSREEDAPETSSNAPAKKRDAGSGDDAEPVKSTPEPAEETVAVEQTSDDADEDETSERDAAESADGDDLSVYESAVEAEIHRLTNAERNEHGLEPLAYDEVLAEIAASHSNDMLSRDYFDHETPDGCDLGCRLDAAGYEASSWAENIAWRMQTTLPGPEALAEHFFENWMDSSGHRENILREKLTHEGVGVVRVDDTVYVTVDFSVPK